MNRVSYIKIYHEEIFKRLLEFEDLIDKRNEEYDNSKLLVAFYKVISLFDDHQRSRRMLLKEIEKDYYMKMPITEVALDPRRVIGHIKVINEAISSKDPVKVKMAFDNDGRMIASRLKEHIFKEEMMLDKLLFLHIVKR